MFIHYNDNQFKQMCQVWGIRWGFIIDGSYLLWQPEKIRGGIAPLSFC
jgi:hypothetical protein